MKFLFSLILLIFCQSLSESVQPYFPSQVIFTIDNYTTIVVDEVNQRAFRQFVSNFKVKETFYALKHIPYAIPDSPQSKHSVQLYAIYPNLDCFYATYWKYAKNTLNLFPSHWLINGTFEVKNYINFKDTMIKSTDPPRFQDYWYSTRTCVLYSGETVPCEQIFFQENTDIPLQSTRTTHGVHGLHLEITDYKVLSIGKINDTIFNSVPHNWTTACRDTDLNVVYHPSSAKLELNQSIEIKVRLISPPHSIDGNDTVTIYWKTGSSTEPLTWTPKTLSFNQENFHKDQILTITRVGEGSYLTLVPFFNGGGFEHLVPDAATIEID